MDRAPPRRRHSGRTHLRLRAGARQRACAASRGRHGDRSSHRGQGALDRVSGEAHGHAAAGSPAAPASRRPYASHSAGGRHRSRSAAKASRPGSLRAVSEGKVHLAVGNGIASVVFDRPEARNAMTWAMYNELAAACTAIAGEASVRVATFRGAGGAFVAGTDIAQFTSFAGAEDGIAYERRMEAVIAAVEELPVPTVAVVEGAAMGGGLAIATVCDLRIARTDAVFGVPIARTVGNCLSVANTARIVAAFGAARAKRLLLLADAIAAEEALACGFLAKVVDAEALEEAVSAISRQLASNAPITMRIAKESIRRLIAAGLTDGEDLVRVAYGSQDFQSGVQAFLAKRRPAWTGR
ncbi:MAG: enoyl-CoA hydratase/isomerase family protein [Methylobacteriaceae bacterium]|nr:enoyl-CoA hydratase/isomerase family protein [Methylobacteriaceae bacterium]